MALHNVQRVHHGAGKMDFRDEIQSHPTAGQVTTEADVVIRLVYLVEVKARPSPGRLKGHPILFNDNRFPIAAEDVSNSWLDRWPDRKKTGDPLSLWEDGIVVISRCDNAHSPH